MGSKEALKLYSLQVPSFPGLERIFLLYPWAICVRLSEYRAPIAATGLSVRGELCGLSFYVNLLDQGLDKLQQGQGATVARTHPAIVLARSAGVCYVR